MREHTGAAIAIAGAATTFFTVLAWLLVVLMWISLTVYALVKWIGDAPEGPSATTVLLTAVALVTALTVCLAGVVALVGRSMTPKRRRRSEELSGVGL
jgi:hypothetical protein